MPTHCSAAGCTNTSTKANPPRRFHGFPFKNPQLVEEWVKAIRRINFRPSVHSRVCSDHFKPTDYTSPEKIFLLPAVVPSIFAPPDKLKGHGKKILAPPPPEPPEPPSFMTFHNYVSESAAKTDVFATRNKDYGRVVVGRPRSPLTKDASVSTEDDLPALRAVAVEHAYSADFEETIKRLHEREETLLKKVSTLHKQAKRMRGKRWKCCAVGCQSASAADKDVAFHEFPTDDETRCLEWFNNINRRSSADDSLWVPEFPCEHRVCSNHFTEECYIVREMDGKRIRELRGDAIPTEFDAESGQPPSKRKCTDDGSVESEDTFPQSGRALLLDRDKFKRKYEKEEKTNKRLIEALAKMFTEDQVSHILRGGRGTHWSTESIERALELKIACGNGGYEHLLKLGFPLPVLSTLKKKLTGQESVE